MDSLSCCFDVPAIDNVTLVLMSLSLLFIEFRNAKVIYCMCRCFKIQGLPVSGAYAHIAECVYLSVETLHIESLRCTFQYVYKRPMPNFEHRVVIVALVTVLATALLFHFRA